MLFFEEILLFSLFGCHHHYCDKMKRKIYFFKNIKKSLALGCSVTYESSSHIFDFTDATSTSAFLLAP